MTRKRTSQTWVLQDAKARFSEVVRAAEEQGPQRVTVHGREAVVIVSAKEFERLAPRRTGAALVAAMRACPVDFDMEPERFPMPVRDVDL